MPVPKTPLLAADCVLFDKDARVLLITRKNPPFAGSLALPGGFVDVGETVEVACRRELMEETGMTAGELRLLGVYSEPGRDPRGPVCSVVYAGTVPGGAVRGGDDAADAQWIADWRAQSLAFDHAQIVEDAEKLLFGA